MTVQNVRIFGVSPFVKRQNILVLFRRLKRGLAPQIRTFFVNNNNNNNNNGYFYGA